MPTNVWEALVSNTLDYKSIKECVSLSGTWGAHLDTVISDSVISLLFWLSGALWPTTLKASGSKQEWFCELAGLTWEAFTLGLSHGWSQVVARAGVIWMTQPSPRFFCFTHMPGIWTEMANSCLGISLYMASSQHGHFRVVGPLTWWLASPRLCSLRDQGC